MAAARQEVAEMHAILNKQLQLAAARLQGEVRATAAVTISMQAEAQARARRATAAAAREAERARILAVEERARTDADLQAVAASSVRLLVGLPADASEQQLAERRVEIAEVLMELPDEALSAISSFLADVKDLGRLACVSRRFSERVLRDPGSGESLSVVEDGARLAVLRHPAGGEAALEGSIGVMAWMKLLQRVCAPVFTEVQQCSRKYDLPLLREGGAVACSPRDTDEVAVVGMPLLLTGVHRAEFTFSDVDKYARAYIGLVGSRYDVHGGSLLQYQAPEETWVCEVRPSAEMRVVLEVDVDRGTLVLVDPEANGVPFRPLTRAPPGPFQREEDALRALASRITVTRDGFNQEPHTTTTDRTRTARVEDEHTAESDARHNEVLVRPGMTHRHYILAGGSDSPPPRPLEPPLRWAAGIGYGTRVRITNAGAVDSDMGRRDHGRGAWSGAIGGQPHEEHSTTPAPARAPAGAATTTTTTTTTASPATAVADVVTDHLANTNASLRALEALRDSGLRAGGKLEPA
eukprot:COSAG06_NODE_25_length_32611_cov_10.451160_13_plen_524_part_00